MTDLIRLIRLEGEPKVVVHPAAALGTDIIGFFLAGALLMETEHPALWMATAAMVETEKLIRGDIEEVRPVKDATVLLGEGPQLDLEKT